MVTLPTTLNVSNHPNHSNFFNVLSLPSYLWKGSSLHIMYNVRPYIGLWMTNHILFILGPIMSLEWVKLGISYSILRFIVGNRPTSVITLSPNGVH